MTEPIWSCKKMEDLSVEELYCILRLRSEVFVVEQNCVYLDADGKDADSHHFCGWLNGELVAYCRILPQGLSYPQASIGRVLTNPSYRKLGFGKIMMEKAIVITYDLHQVSQIKIGAQEYLLRFYNELGFRSLGDSYMEDGIPHISMIHHK
jgi:ElaA protein